MARHWLVATFIASITASFAAPAYAQVVSITQAKVNAGGVTPGDTAGFPVTISRSGSYRLDTNLDFTSTATNKTGIWIAANDVTIDFNGFRLQGWNIGGVGVYGAGRETARIMNGVIAGFKGQGIWGRNFWTVQDMQVIATSSVPEYSMAAVDLGHQARVQRNTISHNGWVGVECQASCLIQENVLGNMVAMVFLYFQARCWETL